MATLQQKDVEAARLIHSKANEVIAKASVGFGYHLQVADGTQQLQWARQELEGPVYLARCEPSVPSMSSSHDFFLLVHNRRSPANLVERVFVGMMHQLRDQFLMWRNGSSTQALWFPKIEEAQNVQSALHWVTSGRYQEAEPLYSPAGATAPHSPSLQQPQQKQQQQQQQATPQSVPISAIFSAPQQQPGASTPVHLQSNKQRLFSTDETSSSEKNSNGIPQQGSSASPKSKIVVEPMHLSVQSSPHTATHHTTPSPTKQQAATEHSHSLHDGSIRHDDQSRSWRAHLIRRAMQSLMNDEKFHNLLAEHVERAMQANT